jgi:hypothetical protein
LIAYTLRSLGLQGPGRAVDDVATTVFGNEELGYFDFAGHLKRDKNGRIL